MQQDGFAYQAGRTWRSGSLEYGSPNQLVKTQLFGSATWQKGGSATATSGTGVAPDGTNTASTLTFTVSSLDQVYQQPIPCLGNTMYTWSVWLWTASGTQTLYLSRTNTVTWVSATVSPLLTITTTPTRYSIWYTTGAGDVNSGVVIGGQNQTGGTPSAGSVFAWGGQLQLGFMGPYRPVP